MTLSRLVRRASRVYFASVRRADRVYFACYTYKYQSTIDITREEHGLV